MKKQTTERQGSQQPEKSPSGPTDRTSQRTYGRAQRRRFPRKVEGNGKYAQHLLLDQEVTHCVRLDRSLQHQYQNEFYLSFEGKNRRCHRLVLICRDNDDDD